MSRRAKTVRNSLVPVKKITPETLASATTFFRPGRQLMNATAICRHWRATLLSSPRLWNRINYSTKATLETYLERSKSIPLEVQLCNTSPDLLESLAPHTSRLSSQTLAIEDPTGFKRLACHLDNPISTLNEFGIIAKPGGKELTRHQERSLFACEEIAPSACVAFPSSPCLPPRHGVRVDHEVMPSYVTLGFT